MAYLVKPFSKADLLPAIELAVARYAETAALRREVADISQRLEARKIIDRAKGLLMTHQKMTEPEAFRWIQRTAMDRRTSMQAVARRFSKGSAPSPDDFFAVRRQRRNCYTRIAADAIWSRASAGYPKSRRCLLSSRQVGLADSRHGRV